MLAAKLLVAFDAIGRHTNDLDAGLAEFGRQTREILGLDGAAGGVVLGIEVDDHRLATQFGKPERLPAIGCKLKVGRNISILQHANSPCSSPTPGAACRKRAASAEPSAVRQLCSHLKERGIVGKLGQAACGPRPQSVAQLWPVAVACSQCCFALSRWRLGRGNYAPISCGPPGAPFAAPARPPPDFAPAAFA